MAWNYDISKDTFDSQFGSGLGDWEWKNAGIKTTAQAQKRTGTKTTKRGLTTVTQYLYGE
jgi:hypothetical protein